MSQKTGHLSAVISSISGVERWVKGIVCSQYALFKIVKWYRNELTILNRDLILPFFNEQCDSKLFQTALVQKFRRELDYMFTFLSILVLLLPLPNR